jgi:hypothetical protein
MKDLKSIFLIIVALCNSVITNGQEGSDHHDLNYKNSFKKHYITVLWGNTLVPAAKTAEGENSVLLFPSLGINYEFLFNHRFGLAWMNEFEIQSYAVEHNEHAEIDREYPVISSVVLLYEPVNHLVLFAGPGIEFEKHHNFSILKAGIAYKFSLPKYYGLGFEFSYELKNKTYDAWTFGLIISKGFGKTIGH